MSFTVGQAIGLFTAIPLCVLVTLMMLAAVRVFVVGGLHEDMRTLLVEAVSLRTCDGLEPLSDEDWARFRRMTRDGGPRHATRSTELELLDAAAIAFAGRRDPAFARALSEERNVRQAEALERLRAHLRATPVARDVIHGWVWWTTRENLRLLSLGLKRLGVDVLRRMVEGTAKITMVTAAAGGFLAIVLWVFALRGQPRFLDYVEFGGTVGVVLGLAGGVIAVFKDAWNPFIAVVPENRRRAARFLVAVYALLLVAMGPFVYYDLPRQISDWPSHVGSVDVGDTVPLALGFVAIVGWLLYVTYGAWRTAWAPGVALSKRLNDLGTVLLLCLLAVGAVVAGVNALIAPLAGAANIALGWITIVCTLALLVVWIASRIAAQVERRRRLRRFYELGLEPCPLSPVWKVVLSWIAVTVAVAFVVFGLALVVVAMAGEGSRDETVEVAGIACLGSVALCMISGSVHVAVVRRGHRRYERRLLGESRRWLRQGQRPAL